MQPPHAKTLSETCECPFQFKSELFFSKIDGRCWKIPHLSSFEARICDVPFGADTAAYPDHLASGTLRANLGHLGTCPECAMSVGFSQLPYHWLGGSPADDVWLAHAHQQRGCNWDTGRKDGDCLGRIHMGAPSMWTSLFNVIWISSRVTPLLLDFP